MIRRLVLFLLFLFITPLLFTEDVPVWRTIKSGEYGIRLKVPDPNACETEYHAEYRGLRCHDEDIRVVVITYKGSLSFKKLRRHAHRFTNIPKEFWTKEGRTRGENGYKVAEIWSATHGDELLVALLGKSAKRPVNHIVFIHGKRAKWIEYKEEINKFIENIHAI